MQLHRFGLLLLSDPATAHDKLVKLFKRHETRGAVASELQADERTLGRWIGKLQALGYKDPRDEAGARATGRKRPAALSEDQVRQIRTLRKDLTIAQVAKRLGVSTSTVARRGAKSRRKT